MATENDTRPAARALRTCADHLDTQAPLQARDWAGFFAALAAFAQTLLPIILPLFLNPKPTDTK